MRVATRFEWGTAAVLALWAAAPVVYLLWRVAPPGGRYTGADGTYPPDQHQYLAWIADAADHVLAGNRLRPGESAEVFLHPMHTPSGLLHALGVDPAVAYLLWKPVAVGVLVWGIAAFMRRLFCDDVAARRLALVAALVMWAPLAVGGESGQLQTEADVISAGLFAAAGLWGYLPTVIAIGLMPVFLLGIERIVTAPGRPPRRLIAGVALAGLLCSWLHPWQGEALLVIVGGLVVWDRFAARWRRAAVPVLAAVLPIAGYALLAQLHDDWALAADANAGPGFGVLTIAATLLPLAAVGAFGARARRGDDVQERVLVLWPVAVLAVHWVLAPSTPYHAFEGLSIPLAVLVVRGWLRLRLPRAALAALVAVLAAAAVVEVARELRRSAREGPYAYFLTADERRAFGYLTAAQPGVVLTTPRLASAVAAFADQQPWYGHYSWSPDYYRRAAVAGQLFGGQLDPRTARWVIERSGARYVVTDCSTAVDLGPLGLRPRRFGCATVYERAG